MMKYDWEKIQEYYDAGHSWNDVCVEFGVSLGGIRRARQNGRVKTRPAADRMKAVSNKMSSVMKASHAAGRHPGWLSVNLNKDRRTYPEQFFLNAINDNVCLKGYTILEKVQFHQYVFDFAIVELKIDIEIDGEYHHNDVNTIEKDKRRDEKAIAEGWKVFRIAWTELRSDPSSVISELVRFVEKSGVGDRYVIRMIELEQTGTRSFRAARFKFAKANEKPKREKGNYYPNEKTRKVVRPTKEELLKLVWEKPTTHIAKDFGVSDRAIGKWCEWYKITKPPRGYWLINQYSNGSK